MRALIILLILSITGYMWHSRRERYNEYEGLQNSIKTAEGDIGAREKEKVHLIEVLQPLRDAKKETETPDGSPELLEKDVETLKVGIKTATEQLDSAEADFQSAVEAVRERAKKQTFPVLKLPSGQELKDCTITKFSEGFVSITHSEGSLRVQTEDLPPGWVEKYSLDYVSRDSKAEKDLIISRLNSTTTAPLDLKNAKVSDIKARIADLENQLLAMGSENRNAKRESEKLIRDAYRIAMDKGSKGQAAASQRTALFDKSKKVDSARQEMLGRYRKLREEKLQLERQLVEMTTRHPGT